MATAMFLTRRVLKTSDSIGDLSIHGKFIGSVPLTQSTAIVIENSQREYSIFDIWARASSAKISYVGGKMKCGKGINRIPRKEQKSNENKRKQKTKKTKENKKQSKRNETERKQQKRKEKRRKEQKIVEKKRTENNREEQKRKEKCAAR